jgi:hypothetical protein
MESLVLELLSILSLPARELVIDPEEEVFPLRDPLSMSAYIELVVDKEGFLPSGVAVFFEVTSVYATTGVEGLEVALSSVNTSL